MSVSSEYTRRWKEKNPEKARESHRVAQLKWRSKNRERVREVTKKWASANRGKINESRRKQHYKKQYGLTPEEREALLTSQGGKCAVCSAEEAGNKLGWVVDHCHDTGRVRGILCHKCNLAIGFAAESPERLHALAAYIQSTL